MTESKKQKEKSHPQEEKKSLPLPNLLAQSVTVGTDPEFFIGRIYWGYASDTYVENLLPKPYPAHATGFQTQREAKESAGSLMDLLKAKDPASPILRQLGETMAFRDGWAVELNCKPASCREILRSSVEHAMKLARERIGFVLGGGEYQLLAVPALPIDRVQLYGAPEDLLSFGCRPSMNAYLGEETSPLIDAKIHPWRYTGGHLHFGFKLVDAEAFRQGITKSPDLTDEEIALWLQKAVLAMDRAIGVPLTLLSNYPALSAKRRQYYGVAGEYRASWTRKERLLSVRLEYRTPGPETFAHPALASMAWGVGRDILHRGTSLLKSLPQDSSSAQGGINTSKRELLEDALPLRVPGYYTKGTILSLAKKKAKLFPSDGSVWYDRMEQPNQKAQEWGWQAFLADIGEKRPSEMYNWCWEGKEEVVAGEEAAFKQAA